MFQLILGISLSVILLFVITLLLTEVAATYPMMNRYERNIFARFNEFLFRNADDRNKARLLLLVLSCILALCITAFFISNVPESTSQANPMPKTTTEPPKETKPVVTSRTFEDQSDGYGLGFSLKTKWEDNRLYSIAYIRFNSKPIWSFKDWSFHLLDKDGYLIRKISFALPDLIFETAPGGGMIGMTGRSAPQELTLSEYNRIDKLQVILDRKKTTSDFE